MNLMFNSFIHGARLSLTGPSIPLIAPFTLETVGTIAEASDEAIGEAVFSAQSAFLSHRFVGASVRADWLLRCADAIETHLEEVTQLLVIDIGKPRRIARFEIQRSLAFIRLCAAQIVTLECASPVLDASAAGADHIGYVSRIAYGVVAAITPFNAPVNLLVQKVIPALAAGNAVVVKPHLAGSRVALRLAELCVAAGLPAGLFNVVTGDRKPAAALVSHPLVRAVTFTGGGVAGDALVRAAGSKKFVAELGSNAANVVLADADISEAASKIARAAFEASGQQCISAQRVIVEKRAFDTFMERFVSATSALIVGDPDHDATDVGPMISLAAADRVETLLKETIAKGGEYALSPVRHNCMMSPAIVVSGERAVPLWHDEVFGPAAIVHMANDPAHALELANDSPFGLQGALFTSNLDHALTFSRLFDVGSLWVNEASRFRLDMVPFGGTKLSGYGREGVKYAIEEMSQLKFMGMKVRAAI